MLPSVESQNCMFYNQGKDIYRIENVCQIYQDISYLLSD